jgi:PAS domain S-box-containing protein
MAVHQLSSGRRLSREELRVELERAREQIADLEADRWQSHERLIDSLAEHLQDGFSLLSPQGVHLDVNPALCAMVGCTREELIGVGRPYPYWPPEERRRLERDLRRHLKGMVGTSEMTFMRKDGQRFPVLITPSVIRDGAGEPVCAFAIIRDISERRRAERELRQSEEKFAAAFHASPDLISITRLSDGKLLEVNEAYSRLLGYTRAESIGKTTSGLSLWVDLADRATLVASLEESGQISDFETTLRRKDGRLLTCVCSAQTLEFGGETCFLAVVHDITARKQAENALAESERRYRSSTALLSHGESLAHLGSWEWDVASDMTTASEEWQRLHGLTGDCFSNDEILLTCHEDDREAMRAALAEAAAGGLYRLDHRIVHPKTHEVRHLMTYGTPLFDAEGRLETVIGASLDVTPRVCADEVLREREERLRRALGDTVAALGATVAMRDPYTAGHERRVSELACLIATRLGWSEEAIERLRIAALVHDVGKIAVPAEILSKPARLTENEFALVKAHAAAASEILARIDFGGPVAEIVLQHHERLDGSGYPRGLRGEEILPGARILAIADVVEAMITHRPYRPALSLEEALAEIGPQSRGRFDPEAAEVCRRLFEEEGFTLPE